MSKVVAKVRCATCTNENKVADCVTDMKGNFICKKCSSDLIKCSACKGLFQDIFTEDVIGMDGYLCFDCAAQYEPCYSCGTRMHSDSYEEINTHKYCAACFDDECTECDGCSFVFENANITNGLCNSCYRADYPIETRPRMCEARYLTTRCFGIELEFENVTKNESSWKIVRDGSLENGTEFISGPIRGVDAINNIREQLRLITGDITKRCSYHLHIDMQDENVENAKKFVMTGIALQDWVTTVVSRSRLNNRYCKLYNRDVQIQLNKSPLDEWIYDCKDSDDLKDDKYSDARYYWLNAHSYFYRKTIEIRIHQGTHNRSKILRWAELWLKVANWSIKQKYDFIADNYLNPDWSPTVLDSIGLRNSTKAYFVERARELSTRRNRS